VFGGSGELAAQLRHGAPFDAVVLAGEAPLIALEAAGRVAPPIAIASNRVVLVGREPVTGAVELEALSAAVDGACVAIGADGVPAGDYARRWLDGRALPEAVGLPHVRAVLASVTGGTCAAGFIYESDLAAAPQLHVWSSAPERTPVLYAAVTPASAEAVALGERLSEQSEAFAAGGFGPPPQRAAIR